MANEPTITITGNLTGNPELRYLQTGNAVTTCTIASTPRTYNKQTGAWDDGETLYLRCTIWRALAEHAAQSLTKGTRVIAQGRLTQRSYTTKEGENRTAIELQVDDIGPSLLHATTQTTRAQTQQPQNQYTQPPAQNTPQERYAPAPPNTQPLTNEPPF